MAAALPLVSAAPAQAAPAPTCVVFGGPRLTACADFGPDDVWSWGEYDSRYYKSVTITLQANVPFNGIGWNNVGSPASVPYASNGYLRKLKTAVFKVQDVKNYGGVEVRACLIYTLYNNNVGGGCSAGRVI
ncbi:hypothetical protein DPM19_27640 [Actinomadura craniellae]|uniref:Secreted protein n=1 Tax=Actinomadura craniellae TaxID=2231787 RepID=A0A365GZB1_9ACTN|nr:hypothetical protein DPM19_27640 [Actinomadura craniellae]